MPVPAWHNERWSMDFFSNQLACGCRMRILNIVDGYFREDVSISSAPSP